MLGTGEKRSLSLAEERIMEKYFSVMKRVELHTCVDWGKGWYKGSHGVEGQQARVKEINYVAMRRGGKKDVKNGIYFVHFR